MFIFELFCVLELYKKIVEIDLTILWPCGKMPSPNQ